MPRGQHATRCDVLCTAVSQTSRVLFVLIPLPVANKVVGVVCRFVATYAGLCFNPAGVRLIYPAATFWPEHKDSGDSGSTESVRIFFAFSCTSLVADEEGTMSLSLMTERIFSSGRRSPLCATLSGITSAVSFLTIHQHSSGSVRICDSGKPESRRMTSRIRDTGFPAAIPASCSVCCPDKV